MKSSFAVILVPVFCVNIAFSSDYYDTDDKLTGWEHIWVGDEIKVIGKAKVEVPKNSTFFDLMVEAAKHGSSFMFDYIDDYKGHSKFITTIGGYEQDSSKSLYWRLYVLKNAPNKNKPPGKEDLSPLSAGKLIVEDNKHYLWWLKLYVPTP